VRRPTARAASSAERTTALSLVTFPGAYDVVLSFILGLGGLFAVIYGAAVAGSEWTFGTLKNAVARGESRSRYTLLSFASIAVVIAVGLVVGVRDRRGRGPRRCDDGRDIDRWPH